MACLQVPSVTLYGTTQMEATTSFLSTYTTIEPDTSAVSYSTTTACDDTGLCLPTILAVTTTSEITSLVYSWITSTEKITSIIPQQTLYYPCSLTSTSSVIEGNMANTFVSATAAATTFLATSSLTASAITSQTSSITAPITLLTNIFSSPVVVSTGSSSTHSTLSSAATKGSSTPYESAVASDTYKTSTPSRAIVPANTASGSTTLSTGAIVTDAAGSSSSSLKVNTAAIVGGTIGGILFTLLIIVGAYCQRRAAKRRSRQKSEINDDQNYWERRFQALEVGTRATTCGRSEKIHDLAVDGTLTRKLRLTMDLGSKKIPDRPASRLSLISSFFHRPPPETELQRKTGEQIKALFRPLSLRFHRDSDRWAPKITTAGAPPTPRWADYEENRHFEWRPCNADNGAFELVPPLTASTNTGLSHVEASIYQIADSKINDLRHEFAGSASLTMSTTTQAPARQSMSLPPHLRPPPSPSSTEESFGAPSDDSARCIQRDSTSKKSSCPPLNEGPSSIGLRLTSELPTTPFQSTLNFDCAALSANQRANASLSATEGLGDYNLTGTEDTYNKMEEGSELRSEQDDRERSAVTPCLPTEGSNRWKGKGKAQW